MRPKKIMEYDLMQNGESGNHDLLGLLLQCKEQSGNDMTN